jgi:hypothetical protein
LSFFHLGTLNWVLHFLLVFLLLCLHLHLHLVELPHHHLPEFFFGHVGVFSAKFHMQLLQLLHHHRLLWIHLSRRSLSLHFY